MIAHTPTALTLPLRTPRAATRIPVLPPTDVSPRFTVDGTPELEQFLAQTCAKIAAGVRGLIPKGKLEAILLGGGYGRGEGGVLETPTGERPYNDLEFYVCVRGNRHINERRFGHALHVLGEILTPQAGVEVEFKIISVRDLERMDVSMFTYDLVMGHRWLAGGEELLTHCGHHREAEEIPLGEATRLLMNRCSGLLFARERLAKREFTAADADFVRRNIAKAELALGDAVLVGLRQYHWSVRERHRRIERLARSEALPWIDAVRQRHAAGLDFKLYPERSTASREALAEAHRCITALARDIWFWIEQRRLCRVFANPQAYAECTANKCPETGSARNVLVHLRAVGLRPLLEGRASRHPRERIFHVMTLLLWEPAALERPELVRLIQAELGTRGSSASEIMAAYRELWSRVN
jgi:hypothetical protein